MLLEVSRAKSPSAPERQAQTEEIMPTSVRRGGCGGGGRRAAAVVLPSLAPPHPSPPPQTSVERPRLEPRRRAEGGTRSPPNSDTGEAERRSRPGPGSTTSPPRRRARAAGSRGTRRRGPRSCPGGSSPLFGTRAPDACAVAVLGLTFNGIGDLGATELASALLDNETLVRVDLRRNRIGDAGGGWTCARWSA